MKDIESQPPNVRKYIYQTVATKSREPELYYDYLVQGSQDDAVDARAGLATGLRDQYFDAVDHLVLDWFVDEKDDVVRQRLLEHMAAQSDKCALYEKPVLEIYRTTSPNSLTRARLEAAARRTDLHRKMKLIAFEVEEQDLFGVESPSRGRDRRAKEPTMTTLQDRAQSTKILIVTALPKELAAVRAMMDTREKLALRDDPHLYEFCTISSKQITRSVILASSGMGTLAASDLAANAIRSYPAITHIIMVGIAGGCPNPTKPDEHVRLGDIVATGAQGGVLQYDNVKVTADGSKIRSTTQKPSAALSRVDNSLLADSISGEYPWEVHIKAGIDLLGSSYSRPALDTDVLYDGELPVKHPDDAVRREGHPRVFRGVIAAADTLQKDPSKRNLLRDEHGVLAIEMEASGIQSAAWSSGRDVFVVRGICDYCDAKKSDAWQNYAALAAAAYTRALIDNLPAEWL